MSRDVPQVGFRGAFSMLLRVIPRTYPLIFSFLIIFSSLWPTGADYSCTMFNYMLFEHFALMRRSRQENKTMLLTQNPYAENLGAVSIKKLNCFFPVNCIKSSLMKIKKISKLCRG